MAGCRGKVHTQNGEVSKEEFVKKRKNGNYPKINWVLHTAMNTGLPLSIMVTGVRCWEETVCQNKQHTWLVCQSTSCTTRQLSSLHTHGSSPYVTFTLHSSPSTTHTWFVTLRYLYTPLLSLLNTHMVCHLKVPLHSTPS